MPDPMTALSKVKRRYKKQLLSLPNVTGLGVGLRQVKGQVTDTFCLVVFVERKVPLAFLPQKDRIPVELDGFPVDVQEIGQAIAQNL